DRWVVWRYEPRADKGVWTKPPFDAKTGRRAKTTDAAALSSFEAALAALQGDKERRWDGVGFVPLPVDGLTAIGLDDGRDPETGALERWARDIVEELRTHTEVSPSGTGLRLGAFGRKPDNTCSKNGSVEMYDGETAEGKPGGRYVTITGQRLDGTPEGIRK